MRTAILLVLELTPFCVVSYFLLRPEEGGEACGEVENEVGIVYQEKVEKPKPSTQTSRSVVSYRGVSCPHTCT